MLTSRSGSQGHSAPPPPQSIEAVRRRARHRLIGAAVMVLLGVIGFPLLFDTQPRPIAVDIPIEIPSRHPAAAVTQPAAPPEARVQAPSGGVSAVESLDAREEVIESAKAPDAGPAVSDPAPMVATPSPSPSPVDAAGTPPSVKPGPKALTKIAEKPSERASEKEKRSLLGVPGQRTHRRSGRGLCRGRACPRGASETGACGSEDLHPCGRYASGPTHPRTFGPFCHSRRGRQGRCARQGAGFTGGFAVAVTCRAASSNGWV